jgi:hypothetical protein
MELIDHHGIPVIVSRHVPRDKFFVVGLGSDRRLMVGFTTAWRLRHGGRDPLLSLYCPGAREARREARRKAASNSQSRRGHLSR